MKTDTTYSVSYFDKDDAWLDEDPGYSSHEDAEKGAFSGLKENGRDHAVIKRVVTKDVGSYRLLLGAN